MNIIVAIYIDLLFNSGQNILEGRVQSKDRLEIGFGDETCREREREREREKCVC